MGLREFGLFLGVIVAWFVLSRWVLPWFGINTCMSGSCGVDPRPAVTEEVSAPADQQGDVR